MKTVRSPGGKMHAVDFHTDALTQCGWRVHIGASFYRGERVECMHCVRTMKARRSRLAMMVERLDMALLGHT